MNKDMLWRRINGDIVPRPYDISIGRREWYWYFAKEIFKQLVKGISYHQLYYAVVGIGRRVDSISTFIGSMLLVRFK
jgi:hypothetical protein